VPDDRIGASRLVPIHRYTHVPSSVAPQLSRLRRWLVPRDIRWPRYHSLLSVSRLWSARDG
jgi:hypothetical protein